MSRIHWIGESDVLDVLRRGGTVWQGAETLRRGRRSAWVCDSAVTRAGTYRARLSLLRAMEERGLIEAQERACDIAWALPVTLPVSK